MGFFDLNIPYLESDKPHTDKSARKTGRLKLIVKAMELGYTGVAYNRTIKGVMSESDRCSISLFPLSSLLKLSPSLSTSVKLRRDLLNVPMSAPFRQYSRLTVIVDSSAQASALNSGNPILKSYDIVAVRPLNQIAFEQACQNSEVDLIAIDFSEKLPFRLKQPMVKAAIGRGVYFEITYSSLIMDIQLRRQTISNAKLLVDWTRGKNLIISSAAPSVTELRGPYDVANISSLLGLSMERAKPAISKNCRSLIANALRKKQFYKEAIRVEVIPSGEKSDPEEPLFDDWLKWDPISSGDGDLLLDDMAKSFSVCNKITKTVKAINFASYIDKNLPVAKEIEAAVEVNGVTQHPNRLNLFPEADQTSLSNTPSVQRISYGKDSTKLLTPMDIPNDFTDIEGEPKISNALDTYFIPLGTEIHDLQSQSCNVSCKPRIIIPDENATVHSLTKATVADAEIPTLSNDINFSAFLSEEAKTYSMDVDLAAQNVAMDSISTETGKKNDNDIFMVSRDLISLEGLQEREEFQERKDDSVKMTDELLVAEPFNEMRDESHYSVTKYEPLKEGMHEHEHEHEQEQTEERTGTNYPTSDETMLGRRRVKQRTTNRAVFLPLKRLLHPVPFKRRPRKRKNKIKVL